MEEEGARRRKYKGRGGAGTRGFLQGLNEDAEDEEMDIPEREKGAPPSSPKAKTPKAGGSSRSKPFELDMDGATLLGRRHKRGVAGVGKSPLAMNVTAADHLDPGSPMRL